MKTKIIRTVTVSQSVSFFSPLIPLLEKIGYDIVAISSDGPELQSIGNKGGTIYPIEMKRHISPWKDMFSLLHLYKAFRKEKPTIVHSMTPKAGLLSMLAAKLAGVPVRIHTFTGLVFPTSTGLKRRILMATDWLTCACASHIIPEGEGVKKDLINNGITKKTIKVLGFGNCKGIDLDHFNPNNPDIRIEAEALKSNKFTFLSIGRLVGDKGINELVDAFKRLNTEYPNTRLLLIGQEESDLDPLNTSTIREIRSNPCIHAVGQQKDVRPWYLASDCAILASYREGFPNVVIEAGAMGLPQIVTDINGANEIIIEGKNGTIVPSKDANALYFAMKRILKDKKWRDSLSKDARNMIVNRYDQNFVRKCLIDFYTEILSH